MNNIVSPMLCEPAIPFDSDEFSFEVKWDGERAIIHYGEGGIKIQSRKGDDVTFRYPELQNIKFECDSCILDGEVVVLVCGKSSFGLLAQRSHLQKRFDISLRMKTIPVTYVAFDCLSFNGQDITQKPLCERRQYLYKAVKHSPGLIEWSLPLDKEGKGKALYEMAKREGLEGIVAKPIDSPYIGGNRGIWKKCKCEKTVDMIFHRYTINNAGIRVENGDGIAVQVAGYQSRAVKKALDLNGEVVIEVKYLNVTENGRLRMPTFKAMKEVRT